MSENSSSPSAATERDSIVLAVNIPPRPALYMALGKWKTADVGDAGHVPVVME